MPKATKPFKPLGELAEIRVSNVDKKVTPGQRPVRLCNYMDVYTVPYLDGYRNYMLATANQGEVIRFGLKHGDVVITKDSETPDDIGVAAVIDDIEGDVLLVCGYHLAILRSSTVNPVFLAKQLGHGRIRAYFGRMATGSTRYGLPKGAIYDVPLFVPTRPEQDRIAVILRALDDAIRSAEKVIAKLENLKRGLRHDLLTRGIDDNGEIRDPLRHPEQFKDSPLGRIPRTWRALGIEQFALLGRSVIKTGPFGSTLKGEHWVSKGVPVITIGALGEGEFIRSELLHVSPRKAKSLASYVVRRGDVVFSRVADVGRSVVVSELEDGWIMSSNLMWISLDPNRAAPALLWLNLTANAAVRSQIRQSVNAGGREVANGAVLRGLRFPWPHLDEQTEIVRRDEQVRERLARETATLAKFRLIKKGLSDDLLTGRVPVTAREGKA